MDNTISILLGGLRVALVSQGCDKNRVDSEVMLGLLSGAGCSFESDITRADAIIINTCGFLQDAVGEARAAIDDAIAQKQSGKCRAIIVTGCATQRYKGEIFEDFPQIDAVLGVHEYHKLLDVLQGILSMADRFVDFENHDTDGLDESSRHARVLSTPGHYAYLKIAEGCDKKCTYCTIPQIRGPYKSREMASLVQEAAILAEKGVKELVLVAQDTALYGMDIYGRHALHELLAALSKIENVRWLRLLYCYPENIYPELVTEISSNTKILSYIDMPIQHASDKILRLMGRKSSNQNLRDIITDLRLKIPDVTLRTTLITGFPGEDKADFKALYDFVSDIKFDRLGVFTYSCEEGTPAAKLPDHLPDKTKLARKNRIMALQQTVSSQILAAKVGHVMDVLVEGFDSDESLYFGRSAADAPEIDGVVYIDSNSALTIGEFVQVQITQSMEYDLLGVVL